MAQMTGTKMKLKENGRTRKPASDLNMEVAEVTGSEGAFERFLAAARALEGTIVPFRADASLAYHNVSVGVESVLSRETQVKQELPAFDLAAAKDLPDLALALIFAANRVDRQQGSTGLIRTLLARANTLRNLLLTSADALAQSEVLPVRAVEKIREGKGSIDRAKDCVELAALFRANADAIRGKTAVTAALITEAAGVGTQLLSLLRPKGAPQAGTAKELQEAMDLRDRFWTLLMRRHQDLRRAGSWLFGDELDRNAPPLQSRERSKQKKPAPASPPPPVPSV